jgi:type IV pilus assembly protein PilN
MRDINFFKPYLGQNKQKTNSKIYVYGIMVIVGLFIIISFGFNETQIYVLDKDINSYNEKLSAPEIQSQLKAAEDINKQIDVLKKYDAAVNDVANSVKARDNVSEDLLKDISSTLPSEVLFNSLEVVENTISIKGVSKNRQAVAELEHNLRELTIMSDVYVNSIAPQGSVKDEYSFDIKCVLKEAR